MSGLARPDWLDPADPSALARPGWLDLAVLTALARRGWLDLAVFIALSGPVWLNLAANDNPNDSHNDTISKTNEPEYRRSEPRSCCFVVLLSSPPGLVSSISLFLFLSVPLSLSI